MWNKQHPKNDKIYHQHYVSKKIMKEKSSIFSNPSNKYEQQQLMIPRIWNKNKNQERSYNNIFTTVFNNVTWKKSRSCVKRCSFTQNLANKTFVEWGHKKFSWILTSIENHIFCQKLIKRHFVVNEFLSYQNLISQSMFGVTKIDKKILYQNRLNDVFFAYQ